MRDDGTVMIATALLMPLCAGRPRSGQRLPPDGAAREDQGSRRSRRNATGVVYRALPAAGPKVRRGLCSARDTRTATETRRAPPLVSDLLPEVH